MAWHEDEETADARAERVSAFGEALAAALLAGDQVAAEIAVREAIEAGMTMAEIDDEMIAPALWLVGELWERGAISIADEHLATEIAVRLLALQREARRAAAQRVSLRVMFATPAGERHTVALRMTAELVAEAGYGTIMLGGDVPTRALAAAVARYRPDVVCLSVTMAPIGARLSDVLSELARDWPAARFVIGGHGLGRPPTQGVEAERCERVSEVVGAVDAVVRRATLN